MTPDAARPLSWPDGSVIVKQSRTAKPFYLCRVVNHWAEMRYYGEYLIPNEEFATRDEAEARAKELMAA